MKVRAAVLEGVNKPLKIKEFETQPLKEGEVLVKITAAGICGSDIRIREGKARRGEVPFPIIPGHEGVGIVEDVGKEKRDLFNEPLKKGDSIIWYRGLTCGRCYYCVVEKAPYLCPERKVYGTIIGCSSPPYLQGNLAEYIHLRANTKIMKIPDDVDPAIVVPAACSTGTAMHAMEEAQIREGDTVVIIGPGPLGLSCVVAAKEEGAGSIVLIGGTEKRLQIGEEFGVNYILNRHKMSPDEKRSFIAEITHGLGADVVIEASGSREGVEEGLHFVRRGGRYIIAGLTGFVGDIPVDFFHQVGRKNVRIQGIWANDASHMYQAVKLILSNKNLFKKLISHRFSLDEIEKAYQAMKDKGTIKAVVIP